MTSAEVLSKPNMGWSSESSGFSLYTCRLCFRVFSSSQALGGHQTAHRKEKSERLIRVIRQAEIDMLKYAADNDAVLSPEPISWAPPATDDQTFKMYNFMPMGDGTSPVPGSGSENKAHDVDTKKKKKQKKRKFMNLSGCSEVSNEASDANQKKKRKYSTKLSECSENKAADADKTKRKRKSTSLNDCSESKVSDELEQKKKKKRNSTKLNECLEHKSTNTGKKKKAKYMKLLSECSKISSDSEADKKKRKSDLSECSNSMASDADQKKTQFTKLMPSPELTLATGAAPDMLVQVFSTDSNEIGCMEFF